MTIHLLTISAIVGILAFGLGRLSCSYEEDSKGTVKSTIVPRQLVDTSSSDNVAGAGKERREVEREIAKLIATLSAAGVAAIAALGQAKALGLWLVCLSTIMFMGALAFALASLFTLYKQLHCIERIDQFTRLQTIGEIAPHSDLNKLRKSTSGRLLASAIAFGSSVLIIAIGASAASGCSSSPFNEYFYEYLICFGLN